jgi:hypothetical protein
MADNLTDPEERRLLDLSLPDDSVYLALFTVAPAEDGTGGTEVSGGAYARQSISMAAASTASGVSSKTNDTQILFPTATAAWGTIVAYGVMSAVTGGSMRWHRDLTVGEQRTIALGDQYRVVAGNLVFTLS